MLLLHTLLAAERSMFRAKRKYPCYTNLFRLDAINARYMGLMLWDNKCVPRVHVSCPVTDWVPTAHRQRQKQFESNGSHRYAAAPSTD
jgi:hypothetical protein